MVMRMTMIAGFPGAAHLDRRPCRCVYYAQFDREDLFDVHASCLRVCGGDPLSADAGRPMRMIALIMPRNMPPSLRFVALSSFPLPPAQRARV